MADLLHSHSCGCAKARRTFYTHRASRARRAAALLPCRHFTLSGLAGVLTPHKAIKTGVVATLDHAMQKVRLVPKGVHTAPLFVAIYFCSCSSTTSTTQSCNKGDSTAATRRVTISADFLVFSRHWRTPGSAVCLSDRHQWHAVKCCKLPHKSACHARVACTVLQLRQNTVRHPHHCTCRTAG
jgi:hypothetical protein